MSHRRPLRSEPAATRLTLACASCVIAGLAFGCAHEPTTPSTPETTSTTILANPAPAPVGQTTTTSASVHVSDEIAKACNMDFNSVERAPKFDFDRSVLRPDDVTVLDEVARCVTTGPLQGRGLHLIGRADPRGEVEYNMVLGASRADAVESYLHGLGVSPANVDKTSRGKLDATGTDEDGWRRDRRVDIDLR